MYLKVYVCLNLIVSQLTMPMGCLKTFEHKLEFIWPPLTFDGCASQLETILKVENVMTIYGTENRSCKQFEFSHFKHMLTFEQFWRVETACTSWAWCSARMSEQEYYNREWPKCTRTKICRHMDIGIFIFIGFSSKIGINETTYVYSLQLRATCYPKLPENAVHG